MANVEGAPRGGHSPCRWQVFAGFVAAACWGSGRCHSCPREAAWSPQLGDGSLAQTRRCTWGLTLSLKRGEKFKFKFKDSQQKKKSAQYFICVFSHVNSLVFIRNWLDTPGWSTSWMAAANKAARISRSVNTSCQSGTRKKKSSWLHVDAHHTVFLFLWHTYIQSWCGEQYVSRLSDISSVEAVVVGHIGVVMVLQGHYVGDECVHGNPKSLQKISLLRKTGSTRTEVVSASCQLWFHVAESGLKLWLSPGRWQTSCSWGVCCSRTRPHERY